MRRQAWLAAPVFVCMFVWRHVRACAPVACATCGEAASRVLRASQGVAGGSLNLGFGVDVTKHAVFALHHSIQCVLHKTCTRLCTKHVPSSRPRSRPQPPPQPRAHGRGNQNGRGERGKEVPVGEPRLFSGPRSRSLIVLFRVHRPWLPAAATRGKNEAAFPTTCDAHEAANGICLACCSVVLRWSLAARCAKSQAARTEMMERTFHPECSRRMCMPLL